MNKYRKLRKEINLSQAQLADMLGVSQTAVSQWETDKNYPDVSTIKTLAEIFCVSTDYLLGVNASRVKDANEVVVYTRIPAGVEWANNIDRDGFEEVSPKLMGNGRDFIGYKLEDNHLRPAFIKDDILIVELTDHCEDGDLVLAQLSDQDAEIHYYFNTTQGVLIESVVPGCKGHFFPASNKEKARILGVVRELRRSSF